MDYLEKLKELEEKLKNLTKQEEIDLLKDFEEVKDESQYALLERYILDSE